MINNEDLPEDWNDPNWKRGGKVHNWHNHVPEEIREIWDSFTYYQKKVLARHFEQLASAEEWE